MTAGRSGRTDIKILFDVPPTPVSQTPPYFAARANQIELAKFLSARKAKINAPDTLGRTPLYEASLRGHKEMIQWLLEQGGRK